MTQLIWAREGRITEAMIQAAEDEGYTPEEVRAKIAGGTAIIPLNKNRSIRAKCIGQGFKTKVNANIGTSPSHFNIEEELDKLRAAVAAGADAVMDLSTGGDLAAVLKTVLDNCPVPVGTVPVYRVIGELLCKGKGTADMTVDSLFEEIERQAKAGVDFVTVHCGVTRTTVKTLAGCDRVMGMVSRGGAIMAEWMAIHDRENPLYEHFDRLLGICVEHDLTLSLGDGLRPGATNDAEDRAQLSEMIVLGELAKRARKEGVQVMIEGPGHVPLHRIAGDVITQKRICDGAPYYVLGPLPTDVAPGYDHLVGAIGGAIAAAAGVDFLCYVTPAEHLHLPSVQDVHDGVIASKIAAHIGDLEKNLPGAKEWDYNMSKARRDFDWESMFNFAIDPDLARKRRNQSEDKERDVCTMCGDMCALKSYNRALDAEEE